MLRKFKKIQFLLGFAVLAAVALFVSTNFTARSSHTTEPNIAHAQSGGQSIAALEAQLAALQARLIALLTQLGLVNAHFDRNLTVGSIGTDVTTLQNWLIFKRLLNLGNYPKGHFGVLTKAALIKWQRAEGISPASGYFGPISRARLSAILTSPITPPQTPPNPLALVVSCSPNITQLTPGGSATWQAQVTGGTTATHTYNWQGTDVLTGNTATVVKVYTALGVKSASVSVDGQVAVPCSLNLNVSTQQTQTLTADSFSVDVYVDQSLVKYADHAVAWRGVGGLTTYAPYRFAWLEADPLPVSYWINSALSFELAHILTNGYQRILLHNPFGQTPYTVYPDGCIESGQMIFSQYLQAQETTPWLVNGFLETWKPVVDSGVEVIAYIGSPDSYSPGAGNGDCEQTALINEPDKWWERAWRALQPYIDTGMSIAFDAAVGTSQNSYTYQLAEALRAKGVRVYVESVPEAIHPHWGSYSFIMSNSQWWWLVPGNGASVPLNQLTGEIFRFVNYPTQAHAEINQILSDGYTASVDWNLPIRSAIPTYTDATVKVDLLANSGSPAGVNYSIKTNPTRGSLIPLDGSNSRFLYTANSGFSGTDTFTYGVSSGTDESLPATVTVNVHAEMPVVTAQQEMTAARQAGAGSAKVVAIWPLFDKDIQRLNINSIIPSNMIPRRVITFQMGSVPISYIVGYNKNTFAPMAMSAGRVLIADASNSSSPQYAAVAESKSGFWHAIMNFFTKIFSYIF